MHWKSFFIFPGMVLLTMPGFTQPDQSAGLITGDTTAVNDLLHQSRDSLNTNPEMAIQLANQAKTLAHEINFRKGEAIAFKNIGLVYNIQSKPLNALENYNQSLKIFEEIQDQVGIANLNSNIGVVYYNRGDDAKALEHYLLSLKYAEQAGDKFRIFIALNNIGGVYFDKVATYDKSLQYFLKALPLSEELDKIVESAVICVNIASVYYELNEDEKSLLYLNKALKAYGDSEGSLDAYNGIGKVYLRQGKHDLALKNHNHALAMAQKLNINISIVQSLMGLGNVYKGKGDNKTALKYYKLAETPAKDGQVYHVLKDLYSDMALTYSEIGEFDKAFKYEHLYSSIKDTLYNIDTDKKLGTLQFDFDLQKKQGEINLLTKDKALSELELRRQKFAKTALAIGLGLIFLITLLIFRNYRIKVKTHKILDRQKGEIEGLLLNILPSEVAKELQVKGHAVPRFYESVAVMFTDFKGFTTIADNMSPQNLVEELSACFVAFDEIIGKYNLEKIKTIGDSYMCAGGIPTPDDRHAFNIIKASLEIRDFTVQNNKRRIEAGKEPWDLRIGIHVGPIVAGVVGKKKYAYDIWGSTVNIASRMESNGEPGQVNISAATYELVKSEVACTYRGKIYAKNVGEIDMYFVGEEKSPKSEYEKYAMVVPELITEIAKTDASF